MIQTGNWIFEYDNLNIHVVSVKVRHNNIKLYYIVLILVYIVGHHNVTSTRLAIEVQKLPPFPFRWNDTAPQKDRLTLKEEDVLPNQEDGLILHGAVCDGLNNLLLYVG